MRRVLFSSFAALTFLAAAAGAAGAETPSIPALIGSKKVLVVGESYGRPESARFVSDSVSAYLKGGGCLKVGLEISSDQQEVLDSAMRGEVPVSDIKINDIIDSPAYREMLTSFSGHIKAGRCLSVKAIDVPSSVPVSRDGWMEKQTAEMAGDTPIILLVGNARAVKESGHSGEDMLLAERLSDSSVAVASTLQYWGPGQCADRTSEYIAASDTRAGDYLKETLSVSDEEGQVDTSLAADGIIVWKCDGVEESETLAVDVGKGGLTIEKQETAVTEEKSETVVRDEKALKKIRWGIKNSYPAIGMTKDEALEAMRREPDKIANIDGGERWTFECADPDGFTHDCYVLDFKDDIVVRFRDMD